MSWRERELSQCVLCVLIFLLAIYQSTGFTVSTSSEISPPLYPVESRSIHTLSPMAIGSVAHPPVISPLKPEILSLVSQEIVPSVQSNAPSGHATKLYISSTTLSPSTDSLQLHIPHGTGFAGSLAPEISVPASTKEIAVTPSYPVDSRSAHEPNPTTLPIGSAAYPPVLPTLKPEVVSPIIQEIVPSVQPSVPSLHIPPVSISPSTNIQLAHDPHGIGSTSNPPSTLLPNSKAVASINHPAAPSIPSSPLIDATKDHNSQRQITYPEGNQAPNVSHVAAHDLSLSHGNPPTSQIRDGVAIRRRSPNVSPLTQHAPARSPRMLPFTSANVLSNSPGLPPSITYPPSTKGFNGPYLPPVQIPFSSSNGEKSASYSPEPTGPPSYIIWQIYSPEPSPSSNFKPKSWAPSPQPPQALPPPPPNLDCGPMTCQQPLTNPSPGSPCACVLPIKVGLRLGVALYIFFPLVSEFAKEIASGISMKQSQVRIMGANSATEDTEKTDVLIDLVPLVKSFDDITVFLTYENFWRKKVAIQASYFGDYGVLYISYPGLPPSPPTAPAYVDGEAYRSNNTPKVIQPLGADVRRQKEKQSGSLIAIIALSSVIALFFIIGAAWLLLLKNKELLNLPAPTSQSSQPLFAKSPAAGTVPATVGSEPSSTSASFSPSVATYTGSAKTFTLAEMERTTNRFGDSRVIGEGGFGRVYQGTLQDETLVAVKVLKRDDQQGEREFLAEVEMLSRLHHRNLVKLIGICTEESIRCLVYELIPNGSVESHLHGVEKITAPLDWDARVKIALGAARGLAYLHEDSIPRVIHRDFKSSNILLEHDFTPKVSDFGLAKSALEEGKEHISTRVMGTFGYLAPEYAMTGHLLVKSDVYSYGVVLLELLTGRKPIDMSQPPGQENLVAWAHPLLTNTEELETIIDPALGTDYPRVSVAKVAAIASMCVQPEVSHRPFMSEVVQALKLVCNENDEIRQSESCSNDELPTRDVETGISVGLCQGPDTEMPESHVLYTSSKFTDDVSGSFRRYSSSGPLSTDRSRLFWQRASGLASRSMNEHGFAHRFWFRTYQGGRWY